PTDGSPEMAAEAASQFGRPVETLRFDQLDEHDQYDAVWAGACLLHVPKADLQGVLARIWRALKPAGLFYASFKEGNADGRDTIGAFYENSPQEFLLKGCHGVAGRWSFRSSDRRGGRVFDGPCDNDARGGEKRCGMTPRRYTNLKIASTSHDLAPGSRP